MQSIDFENAYYIKLGRKGIWEESSINQGIMRIGWKSHSLEDINLGRWDVIESKIRNEHPHKGVATRDLNALRYIVESTPNDLWITFYASHLWWCRVGKNEIFEDKISKFRKTDDRWHNTDINQNPLLISRIPGRIAKIQRFAGTACRVRELNDLRRILNDKPSEAFKLILQTKEQLVSNMNEGLKLLHWKDFETLVDLVFRNAGWHRKSLLGETMKYADIELEEPITRDLYQVQVKSTATVKDFIEYKRNFSGRGFRKLYFVVHSPQGNLSEWKSENEKNCELLLPDRLSQMVVDAGLVNWLLSKIK